MMGAQAISISNGVTLTPDGLPVATQSGASTSFRQLGEKCKQRTEPLNAPFPIPDQRGASLVGSIYLPGLNPGASRRRGFSIQAARASARLLSGDRGCRLRPVKHPTHRASEPGGLCPLGLPVLAGVRP
jgi:hypothetical protein